MGSSILPPVLCTRKPASVRKGRRFDDIKQLKLTPFKTHDSYREMLSTGLNPTGFVSCYKITTFKRRACNGQKIH
jgi:hypothetical protein